MSEMNWAALVFIFCARHLVPGEDTNMLSELHAPWRCQ